MKDAPHGQIKEKYDIAPLGQKNEGIVVPANISYAAKASLIKDKDVKIGTMVVLSNILTYDYLWNNVRVKGGAYGTGFRSGVGKTAAFYSYRDPKPANTLNVFKKTRDYLEDFLLKNRNIENYIVGTTGEFDPLLSTKGSIASGDAEYLTDYSYEDKCEILTEILNTDLEDIKNAIPIFDAINEEDNICIIGNKAALDLCKDDLKSIFDFSAN